MADNIFEQCGTTHHDVCCVVKRIARQLSAMYDISDYYDELVSHGMLTAIEYLKHYDKERNAKATTYLYRYVWGRLKQLASDQKQYILSQCGSQAEDKLTTESSREVPLFLAPDPYRQRPDVIYDVRREQRVIEKVCEKHRSDIEMYRSAVRDVAKAGGRSRVLRQKTRCATKIRQTLHRVFVLNRPLSAISSILESFSTDEENEENKA